MASKRDEAKAWKKLLDYPRGKIKVLKLSYSKFTPGISIKYEAYISGAQPFGWSDEYDTPMEAVDAVIEMMEKGGKDEPS